MLAPRSLSRSNSQLSCTVPPHSSCSPAGSTVNRGLTALADVVSALAARRAHVPYRNSKLTHLLQDSLGFGARTVLLVAVRPEAEHRTETLRSLLFATKMRSVAEQ